MTPETAALLARFAETSEQLRLSELQLRSVWEGAADGMLLVDGQRFVLRVNPAYCRMSGVERSRIEGAHVSAMYLGNGANRWKQWWACAPPAAATVTRSAWVEFASGRTGWFDISSTRINVPDLGRQHLMVFHEVTDQVRAARELAWATHRIEETAAKLEEANLALQRANEEGRRLTAEAEALSRAKSEFLAAMSHEIRTPLHGILGMTELALKTPLTPEQREYLQLVESSADSLLLLLNDVLDYSKAEAGRMELHAAPFSLREMMAAALRPLALRAAARNLLLGHQIGADVPDYVSGDCMRLRQVLLNVAANAIKFTHHGSVQIDVSVAEQCENAIMVHFRVTDTGIGIAPERQKLIFQPFRQADGSTTRRYGGTGLGLSISSTLIGLMQGRIWVESEPDRGSTFHFTARLELLPAEPDRNSPRAAARSLHVLVAEDNPVSRTLLVRMLERHGHRITSVSTGCEAVDETRASEFDAILMDLNMPELDGLDATRTIRATEQAAGRRRQPIFALTADYAAERRPQALAAGIDDILTKPFQEAELMHLLDSVLRAPVEDWGGQGADPAPGQPLVDKSAALSRTGGDTDLLAEIAALFIAEYPRSLGKIEAALAAGDYRSAEREAHGLKGSVANFGAAMVVDAALAVEMSARKGDAAGAEQRMRQLEQVLARLRPELEALTA